MIFHTVVVIVNNYGRGERKSSSKNAGFWAKNCPIQRLRSMDEWGSNFLIQ